MISLTQNDLALTSFLDSDTIDNCLERLDQLDTYQFGDVGRQARSSVDMATHFRQSIPSGHIRQAQTRRSGGPFIDTGRHEAISI
jgi:hypothetical protein